MVIHWLFCRVATRRRTEFDPTSMTALVTGGGVYMGLGVG
jgi:hypothetical protein